MPLPLELPSDFFFELDELEDDEELEPELREELPEVRPVLPDERRLLELPPDERVLELLPPEERE